MTRARLDLALSWSLARNPGGRASRKPSRFLDHLLPEEKRAPVKPAARRGVANCRECGKPLATGAEKKRGRCTDCPASYDEELFERLREWRKTTADEESVPAFVIFTDATLQLIAEHKPQTPQALLKVNGIGRAKLERYGEAVLTLVGSGLGLDLTENRREMVIKSFAHYRPDPVTFSSPTPRTRPWQGRRPKNRRRWPG